MMEKHQLRKTLLAMRKAMPPDEKAWRDKAIAERLAAWLEENPAASIGVYWPTQGEPDLTGVYSVLADRGIRLALPVVVGRDAPLAFHPWRPGDALAADAHGVMAPAQRGAAGATRIAGDTLRGIQCRRVTGWDMAAVTTTAHWR